MLQNPTKRLRKLAGNYSSFPPKSNMKWSTVVATEIYYPNRIEDFLLDARQGVDVCLYPNSSADEMQRWGGNTIYHLKIEIVKYLNQA